MQKQDDLKNHAFKKDPTIGILGGGQLAQLLSLKAKDMGVKAFVLSPSKKDPAAQGYPFWIPGDPLKIKDLQKFFSLVDVVTFESEFFPTANMKKALKNIRSQKPLFAPSLKVLSLIQDRWTQKKLLKKYKIPTADFIKVDLTPLSQKKLTDLWGQWGPFVLKKRMGAYDGKGTFIIKKKAQISHLPSGAFIAEKFVPFKRELAFLAVRSKKTQLVFFPLVESWQKKSICLWIKGPAHHKKWASLKKQVKIFLNEIKYQGLMAFELFDIGERLMVNELAPRVHNTGHYSLDSLSEDQFSAHLKAINEHPLSQPKIISKGFAMLNLLGEQEARPFFWHKGKKHYLQPNFSIPFELKKNIYLYWYGKVLNQKNRKMGHINSLGPSPCSALDSLLKIRSLFQL